MDISEIRDRINEIKNNKKNDAEAHEQEDKLFVDFITYIANYCNDGNIENMAKECLKSKEIKFNRWYE